VLEFYGVTLAMEAWSLNIEGLEGVLATVPRH
jgi:hypothetical protein